MVYGLEVASRRAVSRNRRVSRDDVRSNGDGVNAGHMDVLGYRGDIK